MNSSIFKIDRSHNPGIWHPTGKMEETQKSIFREKYRVVSVEDDRLLVRGEVTGEVLTIVNPMPGTALSQEEYPPGKLIALSDPSTEPLN
jgi:hypothetical protein